MSIGQSIGMLARATRHARRMHRGRKRVEAHLRAPAQHPVPMPTFVQFRVTNRCDLRCKMCGQWGDTGIYRKDEAAAAIDPEAELAHRKELLAVGRELSLADYERVLDELAPHDPIISLFGGEPFLYPDIIPLMRAVKARDLGLTVITNGGRLAEHAEELVNLGIDSIAVSIDGPETLHNRIRGRDDSHQRLLEGVREVARIRDQRGAAAPMLIAILPITELNLGAIDEALAVLREVPLDAINIGLRWFIPPSVGADYERVMRETFGVRGESWKGFEFEWRAEEHATQMAATVETLKRARRRRVLDVVGQRPWLTFIPQVAPDDVPRYFAEHDNTFGHDLCPVAWYFAQIQPDGGVTFCGDFPDYIIGNVRRQSFTDLWTGERALAFRQKLAREPLPVCSRCCGSFVYGKWKRPQETTYAESAGLPRAKPLP